MKRILYIIICFVAFSCKRQPENEIKTIDEVLKYFNKTIKVKAENFLSDTLTLMNPFDFKIFNDVLLVEEIVKVDNNIFSVYDIHNQKLIGKFLKLGKGPNEFLGARIFPWRNDSLMVLKVFSRECQIFSHSKIKSCNNLPDRKIIFQSPNKGEQIDQCFFFNNNIITSGQFKNGVFNIYNTSGQYIKTIGQYPSVNYSKSIDNYELGYIFGPTYSFIGNNDKLIAYIYHAGFSITDKNLNESSKIIWNKPLIGEATYKDGKPIVSQKGQGLMLGAGDITANNKYIFISFSKYDFYSSMKLGIENEYDYILISDWKGNPIGKFELDNPIKGSLEIDTSGNYLYAMRVDIKTGFPQIIRYNISKYIHDN